MSELQRLRKLVEFLPAYAEDMGFIQDVSNTDLVLLLDKLNVGWRLSGSCDWLFKGQMPSGVVEEFTRHAGKPLDYKAEMQEDIDRLDWLIFTVSPTVQFLKWLRSLALQLAEEIEARSGVPQKTIHQKWVKIGNPKHANATVQDMIKKLSWILSEYGAAIEVVE